jgi:acyl-coenzyme A thioesterase PaaI-like protein
VATAPRPRARVAAPPGSAGARVKRGDLQILEAWQRLGQRPFGRWLFARAVCWRAPYFATIRPQFHELRPGRCAVGFRRRRAVLNHLGSVHAIAIANLCELAAGVLMEATLPVTHRWIPRGMTIEYLARAEGDVLATARLDRSTWGAAESLGVPVTVADLAGRETVRAVISMYVSPRPAAAGG